MPVQDVGGGTMMGKANAVPYEDQAGMSEVQRKRLLMQQLLKESLSGGSGVVPDSGAIKVPDYAGAIGKVLQAYIGTKGAEAGAKEAADVAAKAQETHLQEMQKFNTQAFDSPLGGYKIEGAGQPEMAGPPRGPSEYSAMSRGNMVEALKNAALSKDPQTRQFGQDLQKKNVERMISGRIEPLNVLEASKYMIPSSMPPGFDPSQAKLQPHINVVGENVVQTTPGEAGTAVPSTPGVTYTDPYEDPTSGLMGRKNLATNKFEPLTPTLPAERTIGRSVASDLGKKSVDDLVKRLSDSYGKLVPSVNGIGTLVDSMDLLDKAYVGKPWSTLELPVQKALLALGLKPDPDGRIPATELIAPVLGKQATTILKDLRPSSDKDLVWAERQLAINGFTDPETTKQVIRMTAAALINDYSMHGKSLEAMAEWGKNKDFEQFAQRL